MTSTWTQYHHHHHQHLLLRINLPLSPIVHPIHLLNFYHHSQPLESICLFISFILLHCRFRYKSMIYWIIQKIPFNLIKYLFWLLHQSFLRPIKEGLWLSVWLAATAAELTVVGSNMKMRKLSRNFTSGSSSTSVNDTYPIHGGAATCSSIAMKSPRLKQHTTASHQHRKLWFPSFI